MWLVIRNNYCCDSGENLDGFLDGLGGGALGGSEGTGGDVGENTTLCRFGVDRHCGDRFVGKYRKSVCRRFRQRLLKPINI